MTSRRRYPTDISDARWALIERDLTVWRQAQQDRGLGIKTPIHDLREIWNAILYLNRTGCGWEYLPHDFPPFQTVYGYFSAWTRDGIFKQLGQDLSAVVRVKEGRDPQPTAGIMDTQSVKTSSNVPTKSQGIDAGKKIVGRKRGIITDTLGFIITVLIIAANRSDTEIGKHLLTQAVAICPMISKVWVDQGFKKTVIEHGTSLGIDVEVVPRNTQVKGFHVEKRRWVVERTFGWLMHRRRLTRDYETLDSNSESMIYIAMIDNLTKRATDETTLTWHNP